MPLDSLPGEDDIVARLKTIPGVDVIEGEYLSDSYKPVTDSNGMFKPYMTVKFSGAFQAFDNGIVGAWQDTQRNTFGVYVVSPDDRTTRILRNQVREKMLSSDFVPTDGSHLTPSSAMSFVDSDLGYNRYVHYITFTYLFNLTPET